MCNRSIPTLVSGLTYGCSGCFGIRFRRLHRHTLTVFDGRTMKSGGAASMATLGGAGDEVAQSVLAETQSTILPLVPYLDTLRCVFIAVALGGIAITIYARLDDWKRGRR